MAAVADQEICNGGSGDGHPPEPGLAFGRGGSNSPKRGLAFGRGEGNLPEQHQEASPVDPKVSVRRGIIVSGGLLKKSWAIAENDSGFATVTLSSNNYALAAFLCGKVNATSPSRAPSGGKKGAVKGKRVLLSSQSWGATFFRRVWRARNKVQGDAFKELAGEQPVPVGKDGKPLKRKRKTKSEHANPQTDQAVWEMLPKHFAISVESTVTPGKVVSFNVLKGHPNSNPEVVATEDSLGDIWKEVRGPGAAAEFGGYDFSSPPRKKRSVTPFGVSPQETSSVASASSSGKKKRCISSAVHLRKSTRRVQARYCADDGTCKYKYFPVEDVDDENEVMAATKRAEEFVKLHHVRSSLLG